MMTPSDITAWAARHGYVVDRYGHMRKGNKRVKLTKTTLRIEKQYECGDGTHRWFRIGGGYLTQLKLTTDDKLIKEATK